VNEPDLAGPPPPLGLFTDLYELTMAAAFHAEGRDAQQVTFDLFVRSLPAERDVLVAGGVETALERIQAFTYDGAAVDYLASLELFPDGFLALLAGLRFTGEVRAVAEGELVFAGEPILSVTAPIIEAQLLETLLINTVGFETMVASKAARVVRAAAGRTVVDFSARRDHGTDAALRAARAAFVGGATATSLVEAARRYGIPPSGTMAHSYVMAHGTEQQAFRSFLDLYGSRSVLLVDTYDTVEGARRAVEAMDATGVRARGVRLDSGDLGALAVSVREVLDAGGYPDVQILVSGDLDEYEIARLVGAGAPIDAFGVGTRLGTSSDAPYLGMVYKLVEQDGEPRVKLSPGKQTLPGRKQVWRSAGVDLFAVADEPAPEAARPLLHPVMERGKRLTPAEPLAAAQSRCRDRLAAWDGRVPEERHSPRLMALTRQAALLAEG
jgi:nicotinate phosphoribosyltransferase